MAAQNIAMQCFIKLCSQFGSLLLVRLWKYTHVAYCICRRLASFAGCLLFSAQCGE